MAAIFESFSAKGPKRYVSSPDIARMSISGVILSTQTEPSVREQVKPPGAVMLRLTSASRPPRLPDPARVSRHQYESGSSIQKVFP